MKRSVLKFENPELKKLEFYINDQFDSPEGINLKISSQTRIHKEDDYAIVELEVMVFEKGDNRYPFNIDICMAGNFRWNQEVTEETLEQLLKCNAPAILLGYIRPYISSVTTGAGYPPLILPLMDFNSNDDSTIEPW
ncbi:MAG: hypothetical protein E7231_03300 [Cellulosilyticum sp.]|nr:hypothetical protein [Cellulosilyticum sp.]